MIIIIAAMTKSRVICKNNNLIWRIPEDLKNFKRITEWISIIMGRKTYDSIGRPLTNRNNIVISRAMPKAEGVDICPRVEEAIEKAKEYGKDIFIIGGASVYAQTIGIADKMFLSFVKKD